MDTDTAIGTKIKKRRQVLRLTQQELAATLGVSKSTVANWERGKHFPLRYLGAVESVLGISLDGEPPAVPELTPTDEWEASVLADRDLPEQWKISLVRESRAARAEYVRVKRERRAAQARQESGRSDPGRQAG